MRLTLDTVRSAEQFCGPNKARILSLRGLKIPVIENLGATKDMFDVLDLTDNVLIRLDNFPTLQRLEILLLSNNRLVKMDQDIMNYLPGLKSLVLTNNRFSSLADLVPITKSKALERLSLLENPVTQSLHYKDYLVYSIPTLCYLDFNKIKQEDRKEAQNFFSTENGAAFLASIQNGPTEAKHTAQQSLPTEDSEKTDSQNQSKDAERHNTSVQTLTAKQISVIKKAISKATTLAAIERYELALQTQIFPPDLDEPLEDTNE